MTVTTDFAGAYQPPGVYFNEVPTAMTVSAGVPPTVVALVGVAQGFQSDTEQGVLSGATPLALTQEGIIPASIQVIRLDTGAVVDPADYLISNPTGSPLIDQSYTTALTLAAGAVTPEGTSVSVTYNYQDPAYFTPKSFNSFADIKAAYGEPLDVTGTAADPINSPLSLAASLAMINGARNLVLLAVPAPAAGAGYSTGLRNAIVNAYPQIETDPTISVVVPVTRGIAPADATQIAQDLKSHVFTAVGDGCLRIGIIGFDPPPTGSAGVDTGALARALAYKRVMIAEGTGLGLNFYIGTTGQSTVVGEGFLAAAYAGMFAALPVQRSLTKQVVQGFQSLVGQPLSRSAKDALSNAGVAVVEANRYGTLVIRHGTSTDRTNVNTREISVVRGRDAMVVVLDEGLDDPSVVSQPVTGETLLNVKSAVTNLLEVCVASGAIVGYSGVAVRLASTDPSVAEVQFTYQPAYPLNYITVTFSVDLTAGTTDLANLTV